MTLLDEIDDRLTRLQSRSAWIAQACHGRLKDGDHVDLTTRKLLAMLQQRMLEMEDHTLYTLLQDRYNNLTS